MLFCILFNTADIYPENKNNNPTLRERIGVYQNRQLKNKPFIVSITPVATDTPESVLYCDFAIVILDGMFNDDIEHGEITFDRNTTNQILKIKDIFEIEFKSLDTLEVLHIKSDIKIVCRK